MAKTQQTKTECNASAEIDRALEIVRGLPMIRRYGGEEEAVKEVVKILEELREKL